MDEKPITCCAHDILGYKLPKMVREDLIGRLSELKVREVRTQVTERGWQVFDRVHLLLLVLMLHGFLELFVSFGTAM
jgi:hypothetical protein